LFNVYTTKDIYINKIVTGKITSTPASDGSLGSNRHQSNAFKNLKYSYLLTMIPSFPGVQNAGFVPLGS